MTEWEQRVLMLRNHGLLTVADNIPDAFRFMYLFQAACKIQVRAESQQPEPLSGRAGPAEMKIPIPIPCPLKMAVHRLRRRYREALRERVADTLDSPKDVDDEIRHLMKMVGM